MNVRIAFLSLGMVAVGMNSLLIAGLLPQIADALHTTEAGAGVSVAVAAAVYAVAGPFLPIALSRFSRRAIMLAAMAVVLAGLLLSAFAPRIEAFYAARALTGLGTAAYTAQAMAAAMELSPPGRSGVGATWVGLGFAVSMALGVPIGTLIGDAFGYRAAFFITAGVAVTAVAGLTTIPSSIRPGRASLREQFRPLTSPSVLVLLLAILGYATAYFMGLTYLHPILVRGAGVGAPLVAVALATFGVCNVVSMLIGGRLVDRLGGLAVTTVCMLTMAVAIPLMGAPIGAVAFLAVAAFGLTGSLVGPASNVEMATAHPDNPATVVGANMAVVQLGAALGSGLGATLLVTAGPAWIAYAAGPSAMFGAAVCTGIALRRRRRRPAVGLPEGAGA